MKTTTIILAIAGLAVVGVLFWWVLGSNESVPETPLGAPRDGTVTLAGTMVCLPHRDTSGPQTMECAYGLLGDDGNYYGLTDVDSSADAAITSFATESRVQVSGDFMLGEDERYATVGDIEIETITAANN